MRVTPHPGSTWGDACGRLSLTLSSQMTCVPGFPQAEVTPEYLLDSQTADLSPDPIPMDLSPEACLFLETLREAYVSQTIWQWYPFTFCISPAP